MQGLRKKLSLSEKKRSGCYFEFFWAKKGSGMTTGEKGKGCLVDDYRRGRRKEERLKREEPSDRGKRT